MPLRKRKPTTPRPAYRVVTIDPPGPAPRPSWRVLDSAGRIVLASAPHARKSDRTQAAHRFARAVGLDVSQGHVSTGEAMNGGPAASLTSPPQGDANARRHGSPGPGGYVVELVDGNASGGVYWWRVVSPTGLFLLTSRAHTYKGPRTGAARRFARATGLPLRVGHVDAAPT